VAACADQLAIIYQYEESSRALVHGAFRPWFNLYFGLVPCAMLTRVHPGTSECGFQNSANRPGIDGRRRRWRRLRTSHRQFIGNATRQFVRRRAFSGIAHGRRRFRIWISRRAFRRRFGRLARPDRRIFLRFVGHLHRCHLLLQATTAWLPRCSVPAALE
jgi:hypothetical protein